MTKDKKTNLLKGAMFAALLSVAASFPASAKEERTPVGHITLNFNADVQAGDTDATISVSVEDGNCSVESADFINGILGRRGKAKGRSMAFSRQ